MSDPNPQGGQAYGHGVAPSSGIDGGDEKMNGVGVSDVPQEEDNQIVESVDGAMPLMSSNSNQLTLLFQGEVYVFESVTPEKVRPFPPNFALHGYLLLFDWFLFDRG